MSNAQSDAVLTEYNNSHALIDSQNGFPNAEEHVPGYTNVIKVAREYIDSYLRDHNEVNITLVD